MGLNLNENLIKVISGVHKGDISNTRFDQDIQIKYLPGSVYYGVDGTIKPEQADLFRNNFLFSSGFVWIPNRSHRAFLLSAERITLFSILRLKFHYYKPFLS